MKAQERIRREDGTYASNEEIEQLEAEEYERHAAGGRARARQARRYTDGTFAPDSEE